MSDIFRSEHHSQELAISTKAKDNLCTCQRYTCAFTLDDVELGERGEQTMADIARSLGVNGEIFYAWRDMVRKNYFERVFRGPGRSKLNSEEVTEIAALRTELEEVDEEHSILRKAAALPMRDDLRIKVNY